MKNSNKIKFDGDMAYIEIERPDLGENMVECREVMTKELFIACYEHWIKSAGKTGRWIYGNEFHWYTASCNKCGYTRKTDIKATRWNEWKFCPNCGARMVE